MRRLDRYLLREGITPFLFGLLLYSSLAIISATLPHLQWIVGAPVGDLVAWLFLQLPAAVVQTLPIALLLAVLLAYGRLASGNEILAIQAGGVAMRRATAVFITLGLASTVFALLLNQFVLPATQERAGSMYTELTSGGGGLFRLARQSIPVGDYSLYFESTDPATGDLLDVRVEAWQADRLTVFLAERASFVSEGLELFDYELYVLDLAALEQQGTDPGTQLLEFVRVYNRGSGPDQSFVLTTSQSLSDLVADAGAAVFEETPSIVEAYQDAQRSSLEPPERRRAAVLFHRMLAEPFANVTLLLIAVPLAVLYARSRAVAFGLSLVVTLAWYLLLTVGQLMAQSGALPIWFGVWAGNGVLAGVGLYLLLVRTSLR